MSVPVEIVGIGSTAQKLRVSPLFDPLRAGIGPEEYFVLSRIDGVTTLRDVIVTTGLPLNQVISIVTRLRTLGALLLPEEAVPERDPEPAAVPVHSSVLVGSASIRRRASTPNAGSPTTTIPPQTSPAQPKATSPIALDVSLPNPTDLEFSILAEDIEPSESERRVILAMARRIGADPWTVLGVAKGTEIAELKKIYFRLSKEVHPDRYYGRRLGTLAPVISEVFESVSRAYSVLTEAKKQRDRAPRPSAPQAPADHAVELFERGCAAEVSGDLANALQLFAASLQVDPQLRVFRRSASCALAARQPKLALEMAKKAQALAPDDPSCARLLARAFRDNGSYQAAEEVLVFALALPIHNDVLMTELRSDLALVRKQLTQS